MVEWSPSPTYVNECEFLLTMVTPPPRSAVAGVLPISTTRHVLTGCSILAELFTELLSHKAGGSAVVAVLPLPVWFTRAFMSDIVGSCWPASAMARAGSSFGITGVKPGVALRT